MKSHCKGLVRRHRRLYDSKEVTPDRRYVFGVCVTRSRAGVRTEEIDKGQGVRRHIYNGCDP